MLLVLQVAAVTFVSIAMALALAHALELPGKLRLSEQTYRAVQEIYYPGFTFGGIGEVLAVLLVLALLFLTPSGSSAFWLTLAAFVALAAMHGTYWLLTHPVNKFWVRDIEMATAGSRFFGPATDGEAGADAPDWKVLRNRWEYSHVIRALFGLTSEVLLVIAIAL